MLYRGARILIMDEPTAVLAPQEIDELFRTLRAMTAGGDSIVFISHKLDEVLAIADRVTVLRRGQGHRRRASPAAGRTKAELARLMVGREVLERLERTPSEPGAVVLAVEASSAENDNGLPALRDVSLEVRAGEIVGLAGVAGNGQSELAEVITGLRQCTRAGRRSTARTSPTGRPRDAIRARRGPRARGPPRRRQRADLSITDNLIMKSYREPPVARGWLIDNGVAREQAEGLKEATRSAPSIDTPGAAAFGRQPAAADPRPRDRVRADGSWSPSSRRAASTSARSRPSTGLLLEQRQNGTAILLISEDLDEILALADRVAVIYEGRIVGVVDAADGRRPRDRADDDRRPRRRTPARPRRR